MLHNVIFFSHFSQFEYLLFLAFLSKREFPDQRINHCIYLLHENCLVLSFKCEKYSGSQAGPLAELLLWFSRLIFDEISNNVRDHRVVHR